MTNVDITHHGDVEHGHVELELDNGTLRGWWTVEGGKGRGFSRVEVGTTGLSLQEAETKLDRAVADYWMGI